MKLLFLVVALTEVAGTPSNTTLLMRGLVVGAETWTDSGGRLEFRTRFEFVRTVDLTGQVELGEGGAVRSLRVDGEGYPWHSDRSPFPVGLQALAVRRWEREGRSSRDIHSCGSGCYVLEGLTWGRSFLWLHDGSFARAFVPTPFAPRRPRGRRRCRGFV